MDPPQRLGVHRAEPEVTSQVVMTMSVIRTKVKLTNAVDESEARRGQMPNSLMRVVEVDARVTPNVIRSVLPPHVVEQLGLRIRGNRVAEYADGRKDTVGITGPVIFEILGRDTLEEALVLGDEVLIGQTVLEKLDLLADCANQRVISNPAHPDQPVSKVKRLVTARG